MEQLATCLRSRELGMNHTAASIPSDPSSYLGHVAHSQCQARASWAAFRCEGCEVAVVACLACKLQVSRDSETAAPVTNPLDIYE